ncbi:MAG TPA: HD-GYP domain-containing protein [Candidatus Krumholzibacteria bacterium]|nr:HD-GYP domain-containing protein [Candidatus Krumholzibacteria bacterium]
MTLQGEFRDSSLGFKLYYFAFIVAGFLLFAYLVRDFPLQRFPEVLLFALMIVIADTAQITLPRGGASIYASSPLDLAAIVLLGPAAAVFVEAIASFFSEVFIQRRAAVKYAFNVPLLIMTVGVAGLAYWAFPDAWTRLDSPRFLVPLGVCSVVYYLVNTVSISIVVSLRGRKHLFQVWKHNYLWTFFHIFAFIPIGAIIALVYTAHGMWTLTLFIVPIYLARYTFKLYVEMKEAHINTVAALTSAIDANDPYTHGHSYRVSRYALRLGRAMGLSARDLEILEYGALLHDIGKIAIEHEILLKKERLSDQEFLSLKQHPTIGADIVENLKFLREAALLVRYHHEQPNGRGYPEGLKGDEIPIGARIILVSDAYDAMTSDRPYRKGLPVERVVEQFEKYRGEQFDREITDIMLDLIRQGSFPLIVENDPTTAIYESLQERL